MKLIQGNNEESELTFHDLTDLELEIFNTKAMLKVYSQFWFEYRDEPVHLGGQTMDGNTVFQVLAIKTTSSDFARMNGKIEYSYIFKGGGYVFNISHDLLCTYFCDLNISVKHNPCS